MAYLAPYRTPGGAVRERRRAAMMRALGGVAAKGPELGTDPLGSFQAGLRGSLQMGQQQQLMEQKQQEDQIQQMRAYADLARATQEHIDPFTRKLQAVREMLGRDLTPDEEQRLAGIDPNDPNRLTAEQKLQQIQTALGRKLTPDEQRKAVGVYIDPNEANPQRLRGDAGEIYDWAQAMGYPMGDDPLHPNPDVFGLAARGYGARNARTHAGLTYDTMTRRWVPTFGAGGMTPDMAQIFQPKPNVDPTQTWFQGFAELPKQQQREEEGIRMLNHAYHNHDLEVLHGAARDPNPYLASVATTYLQLLGAR